MYVLKSIENNRSYCAKLLFLFQNNRVTMAVEEFAPFLANYGQVVLAVVTLVISLYVLITRWTAGRREEHEAKLRRVDEDNYIMQDTAGGCVGVSVGGGWWVCGC